MEWQRAVEVMHGLWHSPAERLKTVRLHPSTAGQGALRWTWIRLTIPFKVGRRGSKPCIIYIRFSVARQIGKPGVPQQKLAPPVALMRPKNGICSINVFAVVERLARFFPGLLLCRKISLEQNRFFLQALCCQRISGSFWRQNPPQPAVKTPSGSSVHLLI